MWWRYWGHCVGLGVGHGTYFCPWVKLKNQGLCSISLGDPPPWGTVVIPVPLVKLGLLLGVPAEWWGRVLVSCSSPALMLVYQLRITDCQIGLCLCSLSGLELKICHWAEITRVFILLFFKNFVPEDLECHSNNVLCKQNFSCCWMWPNCHCLVCVYVQ